MGTGSGSRGALTSKLKHLQQKARTQLIDDLTMSDISFQQRVLHRLVAARALQKQVLIQTKTINSEQSEGSAVDALQRAELKKKLPEKMSANPRVLKGGELNTTTKNADNYRIFFVQSLSEQSDLSKGEDNSIKKPQN